MEYLLLAILIDLIVGDPEKIPHPVVIIGRIINFLEKIMRKLFDKAKNSEIVSGFILVIIITAGTFITTMAIIKYSYLLNYYFGLALHLWLISTTIAIKGLIKVGLNIYKLLDDNNLEKARKEVSMVVGRDTDNMDSSEVVRSVIETLAENTSDGILAPIFYYALGGLPLAMTYKAINTLDSMLGYKNDKYRYFGRAAACLDDIANYIPARLTGLGFCLAGLITGKQGKKGIIVMYSDARKHPSWNAGYPEAAVAGVMGIRLGGLNYYEGEESFRAYMGNKERELKNEDVNKVIRLIYVNIGIFIFSLLLINYLTAGTIPLFNFIYFV